jgi:hydrogenase nickel incorporation protein HypA/HybF
MHELSIATALVSAAADAADRESVPVTIIAVSIRIGDLSGIVPEALEFAWPFATEGTRCEGAELRVDRIPGRVRCAACDTETELASPPRFRCGRCGEPAPDITAGRELELVSLELADETPPAEGMELRRAATHP